MSGWLCQRINYVPWSVQLYLVFFFFFFLILWLSQNLPDWQAETFAQTFMIPRGWIKMTRLILWCFLDCHHEVDSCGFAWKVSTTMDRIALKFSPHIHVPPQDELWKLFHVASSLICAPKFCMCLLSSLHSVGVELNLKCLPCRFDCAQPSGQLHLGYYLISWRKASERSQV